MEFQPTLYDTELIQSHNLESKVVLKEKYRESFTETLSKKY